jgi:chemotaxis protein methyltransferase CheR
MTLQATAEGPQFAVDSKGQPTDPTFPQIRNVVYQVSGIFQADSKLHLLADACGKRMAALKCSSPREYLEVLTTKVNRESELRALLNEVTIGETFLFRSMPQINALRTIILPGLVKDPIKQLTKRLRIWSAGCSTGEEPHTLAICCLEEQEKLLKGWNVEIIATDLNDRSIEVASAGVYGDYAMRFVSDLFKLKYFKPAPDGKKFEARDEVKKLIQFKRLNLRDDAKLLFMKGMDLIYCCNVLIYFDSASKSRVIQHYYNNLNTGGYLFLGISESLYQLNDQFRLVHFPGAFGYWKAPPGAAKT